MEVKSIFIVGINFLQLYFQKRKKKVAKLLSMCKISTIASVRYLSPFIFTLGAHMNQDKS